MHQQATADAGAEGQHAEIFYALPDADPLLAQSGAIGIVLQHDWHCQASFEISHHGIIIPARKVGSGTKDSVRKIDNSRNSYSNAKKLVRGTIASRQAPDRRGHLLDDGFPRPLCPLVNGLELAACRVNRGDSQVRPPQVDTNRKFLHWIAPRGRCQPWARAQWLARRPAG